MASIFLRRVMLATLVVSPVSLASAQVVLAPTTPEVGSSNPVTAQPLVPRPTTKPCTVQLFTNLEFANYDNKTFSYQPPAGCPGPWAKVVFTSDFTVTAGTQYDRTGAFYLGGANIYYGTTSEPSSDYSPSWHVERDVTDLSYIFKSEQTGTAVLGNYVGVYDGTDYDGIIYANAELEFYPANPVNPAPAVPDLLVPVTGSGGTAGTLNTTTDTISQTVSLPENVESVYLDVIAQPQSDDEFYYFNVPTADEAELASDGGTAFREVEVWIDGKPAGAAPVYPFLNTGGIDPNLWIPIVGNQTHEFKPFRVNLTPFAGLLGDGSSHTVAVSVFNANSYFLATANLLVYEDHGSKKVTGGVLENTLTEPSPTVTQNLALNSSTGEYTGTVSDDSSRSYVIKGYVNTSHGRVETTLQQTIGFTNTQTFDVNPSTYTPDIQNAVQNATLNSVVTTTSGRNQSTSEQHFAYPITVDFAYGVPAAGGVYENVSVDQIYKLTSKIDGGPEAKTYEETKSVDDQLEDAEGNYTDTSNSSQTYRTNAYPGGCYDETLTAASNVLTDVTDNCKNQNRHSGSSSGYHSPKHFWRHPFQAHF
ncbi:peptide-N4-asparagine amidase [Silvibacterium sp.]|uniref:peptide-N4-asparagine amidase n=1 Tax=Silvibacterium sp. TaxID=1964179 RepID=UPI0039E7205D